jgi:hypothetical protein
MTFIFTGTENISVSGTGNVGRAGDVVQYPPNATPALLATLRTIWPSSLGATFSVLQDTASTSNISANICFPAKTPVVTDQGEMCIDKIEAGVNTINGEKIVAITKTLLQEDYLVSFDRDSLGKNYPAKKTVMSGQHKILYKGKMVEAHLFVNHFNGVKKVKYDGEIVYNVLMENYNSMKVNNLTVETLHPQNIVAKVYRQVDFDNLAIDKKEIVVNFVHDILKRKITQKKQTK